MNGIRDGYAFGEEDAGYSNTNLSLPLYFVSNLSEPFGAMSRNETETLRNLHSFFQSTFFFPITRKFTI